jgi:BlaI family penicillinase repressor
MSVQLTKAEEQVMQALWKIGSGSVQDVLEMLEAPKPARTTVSTVLTILENKGFASHTTNGRANNYKPLVLKEDYSKGQLFDLIKNYFDNSFSSLTSFFARESNYTVEELDNLIENTRKELQKEKEK